MHGFTAANMAELSNMGASTYSFIEAGSNVPSMEQFISLCKTMEYDPASFFVEESKI